MFSDPNFITFADVVVAYRKAKKEAFWDTNCALGFAFIAFEENLEENLDRLHSALTRLEPDWCTSSEVIGTYTYVPKGLDPVEDAEKSLHFIQSDPLKDWNQRWAKDGLSKKPKADFRIVASPTVEYLVISALWILKVGYIFDGILDDKCVYGNRIRRSFKKDSAGQPNTESFTLFEFYPKKYGEWKSDQLKAIREALEKEEEIVAFSFDIRRYYHRIEPSFLVKQEFLDQAKLTLTSDQILFTEQILKSIQTWRDNSPERDQALGLPVGMTFSAVIANALLYELDTQIKEGLMPLYYGRYVDDLFIVVKPGRLFSSADEARKWLEKRVECLVLREGQNDSASLHGLVSYSPESSIEFGADKCRIFCLEGKAGLDVIQPVEDQIRKQKSEHRLLPDVPDDESAMAGKALLVNRDGGLEADVLRKADVASIRRFGFANLLSDLEDYAVHLRDGAWAKKRGEFYGLAHRHLASPQGVFDFARYIPRVIGLMAACDDVDAAFSFLDRLEQVQEAIIKYADTDVVAATSCWQNLCNLMLLAVYASGDSNGFSKPYSGLVRRLQAHAGIPMSLLGRDIESIIASLIHLDWARIPFYQYWLDSTVPKFLGQLDASSDFEAEPEIPSDPPDRLSPYQHVIREFCGQREFCWRPFTFPTRPIPVGEISRITPLDGIDKTLPEYCEALRGVRVGKEHYPRWRDGVFTLGKFEKGPVSVAVTSILTTEKDFRGALLRAPQLSQQRYENLHRILNEVAKAKVRDGTTRQDVDYVAMPELSLPRSWSRRLAQRLAKCGISLIAGLEYAPHYDNGVLVGFRNETLISLTASVYLGGNLMFEQNKLAPAWKEDPEVRRISGVPLVTSGLGGPTRNFQDHAKNLEKLARDLPIYRHKGFGFGVLLCSDLTSIQARERFQGQVDAVFIPEWNSDLDTFDSLVESGSLDIHAFVVQANNRKYGDSRIRAPYKQSFRRDVVRLKGGEYDFFVIGKIDFWALRRFQTDSAPNCEDDASFKPFPVGFKIAAWRKYPRGTS